MEPENIPDAEVLPLQEKQRSTIITVLCILGFVGAAICQTPAKVKFSGVYLAVQNGDSIVLHFLNDHQLSAKIGHNQISNVDYKTAEVKQEILITMLRSETGKKDSWVIKLLAMDDHEYQIKNIMHYFSDPDQPPESELLEGKIYILKKKADH